MTSDLVLANSPNWQQQAQEWLYQGNYSQAANLYISAINTEPHIKSYYWYLGLLLLLQGEETEAQTTWLVAMADGNSEEIEQWTAELVQVLQTAAEQYREVNNPQISWVIRQHIRAIIPEQIDNLLHLVCLSAHLENLTPEDLETWGVIQGLQSKTQSIHNDELILQALQGTLAALAPNSMILEFTEGCLLHLKDTSLLMAAVLPAAIRIAHELKVPKLAADLLQLYRRLDPNNTEILGHLSGFYQDANCFERGVGIAQLNCDLSVELADKIFASHSLLRGLMTAGGRWQEGIATIARHKELMATIIAEPPLNLSSIQVSRLWTASMFLPYFKDAPKENHTLQNQLMAICQENAQLQSQERVNRYSANRKTATGNRGTDSRLKVGYLSHCMGRHSVGYLARWLIKHHDHTQFQLFGYFINDRKNDILFDWYVNQMEQSHRLSVENANDSDTLADQISQDNVDILVDLDSLTLDLTCHILALKPAPVQVTWLGWDASGIPAMDYFMADPHVLPERAQDYYSEKIWRLPHTYIAVDGFEVEVPTLRRDHLGIPADAIAYLSAQKGYKRHRDTAKLQMQIIKNVPSSYFLIKGFADQNSIQDFFIQLAEEEGVDPSRLKFLPSDPTEAIHRANLGIADVVLDTYPYNGATTTLETLWMGIPLVTRVGEQFAARNSYTMLMNVGVQEGIAWTDEEYVEWGVRFGTDEALRQQVHWKLRQSRHTAPLWNAKQFTRDMENAYQQMWQIYCEGGKRV
jgi:predicted O-linked N-acetylglucosamine transferase (SPINDLY family)